MGSKVAVRRLNVSPSFVGPEQSASLDQERDRAVALLGLALLLLKLNSKDSKALEWASGHPRGKKRST